MLGRNELVTDDSGRVAAKDTGEREELPVQLVVRSVGYRGVPTPGLPFDEKSATIPNTDGRVDGSRNEYVVGWIKRGPTGVIGTNKKDSQDTVDTLIADLTGGDDRAGRLPRRPCRQTGRLAGLPPAQAGHRRALEAHRPTSNARPASRTGVPASNCRTWPSCCTSATADQIDEHAGVQHAGRVERRLRRTKRRREWIRPLAVVPRPVVPADRVMVGDRAARVDRSLRHRRLYLVPLLPREPRARRRGCCSTAPARRDKHG